MSGHTYTHTRIHTHIHTHRTTTVTLAAHARLGLIKCTTVNRSIIEMVDNYIAIAENCRGGVVFG